MHTAAACFLLFGVLVGYFIFVLFEHLIVLMLTDISEYIKFCFSNNCLFGHSIVG